jgi:hypothetical protein
MKPAYEAELEDFALALPGEITGRTNLSALPSTAWVKKYIPTDKALEEYKEAKKTPEEREAEQAKKAQREAARQKQAEEREAANLAREALAEKLKQKYHFLRQADGVTSGVNLASANIRTLLSRLWPATSFSVRLEKFSGGNSIDVSWTDGPTDKQVSAYTENFQSGGFDSMTDSSYSVDNAWHIFGSTKYMHTNRSISAEAMAAILPAVQAAMAAGGGAVEGTYIILSSTGESGYNAYRLYSTVTGAACGHSTYPADVTELARGILCYAAPDVPENDTTTAQPDAIAPETTTAAGVVIRKNEEHNGIEIKFQGRPADSVLNWLKANRFRWSKFQKIWYAKFSEALFQQAQQALTA